LSGSKGIPKFEPVGAKKPQPSCERRFHRRLEQLHRNLRKLSSSNIFGYPASRASTNWASNFGKLVGRGEGRVAIVIRQGHGSVSGAELVDRNAPAF
jgi:hypothetical protein